MLNPAVRKYLGRNRSRHLRPLLELLGIPSVANAQDGPARCRQAARWLARHLKGLGLSVETAETSGNPCVLASGRARGPAPTLLIYGHYDVQPPDPLDQWKTDPFHPVIRRGWIHARGADDDKGQFFAHLLALEAWQRAGGGLPVNVKVLLEGEEEIGSPNLEALLAGRRRELAADAAVISDSGFFADGVPSITYGLRGVAYVELTLTGPAADVHSGIHGGAVANPVNALAALIAAMHDPKGRVTLEGFYDDVLPLTAGERRAWRKLRLNERRYASSLGLEELGGGEKGLPVLERRWARPTLDCNGIFGGYSGKGSKTIIPSSAGTKITMRLVPEQDPHKVAESFRRFVAAHTPPGVRASPHVLAEARPVLLRTDSPAMQAGRQAMQEAFGRPVVFIRGGASVPVTEMIQRLLGLDAVLMGFGLPQDNLHSPNERFRLNQLWRGAHAAAAFLQYLADGPPARGRRKA